MNRIVYSIASHVNPSQVMRLIDVLSRSPGAQVVVHQDYGVDFLDPKPLRRFSNVYLFPHHLRVSWASYDQVEVQLRLARWIEKNLEYDWLTNLTGQDYPIRPLSEMVEFLGATDYDGFIDAKPLPDMDAEERRMAQDRYYFHYWRLPANPYYYRVPKPLRGWLARSRATLNRTQGFVRMIPGFKNSPTRFGMRCINPPYSSSFRCCMGSSLWSLSRHAVRYMLEYLANNPQIERHYASTFAPSESILLTVLLNNPALAIFPDNLRFMRWGKTGTSAGPDTLSLADLPELIASGKYFARKIDGKRDPDLLEELDMRARG